MKFIRASFDLIAYQNYSETESNQISLKLVCQKFLSTAVSNNREI
jgi:hypothetical protein